MTAARVAAAGDTPQRELSNRVGQSAERVRAHRQNGFDVLRVVAALMVLFGHSFPLTGHASPGFFHNSVGSIGVKIFFVISGLLVTRSWLSDTRPFAFAIRRCVRIVPALACLIAITVLVLGPIFTGLPLREYFCNRNAWDYFWNVAFYPYYSLPGVFAHNPYPLAVNGSLWSLPAEVLMYVLTPFVVGTSGASARVALPVFGLFCALGSLYFVHVAHAEPAVIYGTNLVSVLDAAVYFQAGAIWAAFNLDRFGRPGFSVLLLIFAWLLVERLGGSDVIQEFLLILALPFAVISIGGLHFGGPVEGMLARGDISYGLYLYGFPIQQAVAAKMDGMLGPWEDFIFAVPFVVLCAFLSWELVEKPALRLKPRTSGLISLAAGAMPVGSANAGIWPSPRL